MATVQARIRATDGHESLVPIVVPDVEAVRAFARTLHHTGQPWRGEAFGWQGEYVPEGRERPLGSRLGFTPAEFCLGESGVWFFSLMWEHGAAASPVEFIDESGLVRP